MALRNGSKFQVYRDEKGFYRWRFRSSNEKVLADSSTGYSSRRECINAIRRLRRELEKAEVELVKRDEVV